MSRDRRLSVAVGLFVVISAAGLAVAVLSLTAESGIFVPQYRLTSHFKNVQGLLAGAPVWLAGKQVGRVEEIAFEPVGSEFPMRVELRVNLDVQDRIRTDSIARIATIGVLGDSYVEVTVGSIDQPVLQAEEEIGTISPVDYNEVIASGYRTLESISKLSKNVNTLVEGFSEGEGVEKAVAATAAVSEIVLQLKEGDGLLHSLIYDEYEGGGVASVERSLVSFENILDEIKNGQGIIHALVYDEPTDQDIVMEALEAGAKLNSILGKVDRGEGTLGLMISDPTLYEDLKVLVGGAQRSAVLRTMIRMAVEQAPRKDDD